MVNIPTTERQFYNTQPKANAFGMTATALLPAAQQYKETLLDQQKVKIDTNTTKARIEIDNFANNWRLANQANPDNPEAKKQFQAGMSEILNRYGSQIDPIAKMEWNMAANRLQGAYDIANNQWALNQRAENARLDMAENINANLDLARSAGQKGNLDAALADYVNSSRQLYDYGTKNMGKTETRKLLANYEEKFMESYINGLASTNPQAALDALKKPEIAASFKSDGVQDMMMKIVNKQLALHNLQRKVTEFNNEKNIAEKLDNLPTDEALHFLQENEANVSSKFYKAKEKALLSAKGINAETRAETASEIMLDIAAINKDDVQAYFTNANNILTKIEDNYAAGYLSLSDRKRLTNEIYKAQGKNINVLKEEGSGWKFWDFSYKDANEYISDNYSGQDGNRLLLDYFRAVSERDYSNDEKKQILQGLIDKTKTEKVNAAIDGVEGTLKIGFIKNGYRYIGGNPNEQNSWEKI